MADNTTLNPGAGGDVIATDDIAGVKHQLVKVEYGADGAATQVSTAAPLPVRLGDGTDLANVTASGELNVLASAQPGVDVGDVTVNNGSGASAVNIQDGGNSITVDGTVSVSGTITANAGTGFAIVATDGSAAGTTGLHVLGTDGTNAQIVSTNVSGHINIADGGNSITVDGTVTANAGSGTFTVGDGGGSLTVDGSVSVSGTVTVAGADAHDAAVSANPVVGAARASDAVPTAVSADGDVVRLWADRRGAAKMVMVDDAGDSAMDGTNNALRVNMVASSVGGGDGAILDGVSGSIKATVFDYTNSNPLAVRLTDTNGDFAAAGGGTQYTEDAASAGDPIGTQIIARRRDSLSAETTTDGDVTAANCTSKGELYVKHVDAVPVTDNGGSLTVDGAVTVSGTVTADAGSGFGSLAVVGGGTEATAQRVTIANDSTGVLSIDDNGGSLTVDGSVTVSGTVTSNAGTGTFTSGGVDAHDAAITGNPVLVGGKASAAAPLDVSADNDAVRLWALRNGSLVVNNAAGGTLITAGGGTEASALRVTLANDSTGLISVDDNAGSLTVDGTVTVTQSTASSLKAQVQGEAAHDAAVAGNPLAIGARANTSEPGTAVADGDATWLWADKWGRLVVTADHPPKLAAADAHGPYSENATASGDTSIIAAPGVSTSIVVTGFWLSNQGASKIRVALTEGAAGTIRYRGTLAADGGGVARDGLRWVIAANTALVVNLGAAGDVDVNIDYYVQTTP